MKKASMENFNKWSILWSKVSRKTNAGQTDYWDIIKEWSEIWIKWKLGFVLKPKSLFKPLNKKYS